MSVCLLIIGDGRSEYHERSVASAKAALPMGMINQVVIVDDDDHTLGFAGAIQRGWDQVDADYVFHLEADFIFNGRVPLGFMVAALEGRPELAQVALKRQAWNEQERAAGGIVEQHPGDYEELRLGFGTLTTHRRFWTTNPCVYPSRYCRLGWPQEPQSEGVFTHRLLADPLLRFAFWGAKHDPPRVHHIGDQRAAQAAGY